MSMVSLECARVVVYMPNTEYANFVAKLQKAKTRKGKDYFVLRVTVPKDIAKKMDAKPEDFLFFRIKKAEWYHMLDWEKMENTWKMLPDNVRNRVIMDGLCQRTPNSIMIPEETTLGATNPSGVMKSMAQMLTDHEGGINGSSV